MKIKMKDLVMIGIIGGIAFFFVGAIISNVFPSSQTDLMSYKVSGSIKLIGIGALTSSMIIGGIIIDDIDKNLRLLLLLLGLVLLTIYTVGSQSLQWYVPTTSQTPTGYGIPGFELISLLGALTIALFVLKKKHYR
jgi:MFS family permease